MPVYELTLHDAHDQPVAHLQFESDGDDEAIELAGLLDHPLRMIVQDGDRVVAHFAPRNRARLTH